MALKIRRNPTANLINVRIETSEDKKWISEIIITKCLVLDRKLRTLPMASEVVCVIFAIKAHLSDTVGGCPT
jgi:hypothetical protein